MKRSHYNKRHSRNYPHPIKQSMHRLSKQTQSFKHRCSSTQSLFWKKGPRDLVNLKLKPKDTEQDKRSYPNHLHIVVGINMTYFLLCWNKKSLIEKVEIFSYLVINFGISYTLNSCNFAFLVQFSRQRQTCWKSRFDLA